VLLLDEPFGALDAKVRKELRRWLRRIHEETGVTTVFVTHDQEEAMDLADRVVVLNEGEIEQVGKPAECSCSRADRLDLGECFPRGKFRCYSAVIPPFRHNRGFYPCASLAMSPRPVKLR
jgi:ABC-type nitrate/sulfonate/bicarbonate transport system ATPase subunit